MNTLIICLVLILMKMNIYTLINNSIEFSKLSKLIKATFVPSSRVVNNTINQTITKNQDSVNCKDNSMALLGKNLGHLELISELELHLENKNHKKFSLELLQEFEQLKTKVQLSTLKSTSKLNNCANQAN